MTVEATPILALQQLSEDETKILKGLRAKLTKARRVNREMEERYEANNKVKQLDIAIPPMLADIATACGWAGTAIDVLEERLDWDNWTSTDDLMGLDDVYRANHLDIEGSKGHVDALIAGVSFTTVGTGDPDLHEPEILVTTESPSDCTVDWDPRSRRVVSALSQTRNASGVVEMETLYTLNETISLERRERRLVVTDRDPHGRNRVPVSPLVNRSRSSRSRGRSELTRAVRYLQDACVRTLLGMEINREFYTAPQRWLMGADMSAFTDKDGKQISGWDAIMGNMLAMPRPLNEETGEWADLPQIGQFTPSPPTPYLEQIRGYSMLFAAEVGFPASYLGYASDNPASADAIKAGEIRLIKRSENRQQGFTPGWMSTAYNILLWRDGEVDTARLSKVTCNWKDAATPTKAAQADSATKLVAGGILPPDSEVTYDLVGLTTQQKAQLVADKRRERASANVINLAEARARRPQPPASGDQG